MHGFSPRMTIHVELKEVILPPATIELPERLNVYEDSISDPKIIVRDLGRVAPSGVALAMVNGRCLRAREPFAWLTETEPAQRLDLGFSTYLYKLCLPFIAPDGYA